MRIENPTETGFVVMPRGLLLEENPRDLYAAPGHSDPSDLLHGVMAGAISTIDVDNPADVFRIRDLTQRPVAWGVLGNPHVQLHNGLVGVTFNNPIRRHFGDVHEEIQDRIHLPRDADVLTVTEGSRVALLITHDLDALRAPYDSRHMAVARLGGRGALQDELVDVVFADDNAGTGHDPHPTETA